MTLPEPFGGAATLQSLLARAAAVRPAGGLRFLDRHEEATFLTWPELERDAATVGGSLAALGVASGDRVGLLFPTGRGFFAAFFGVLASGAVPVPLYPPVRLGRLAEYHARTRRMLELVGARLVLADRGVRRILGETVAGLDLAFGCRTLDDLPPAPPLATAGNASDLALVQFSSGTTVDPKPVSLSQRAIVAQLKVLDDALPADPPPDAPGFRHEGVSWLPLYHDMGLIGCALEAVARASVLTLLPPELFVARPALWLRAISRWRAAISPAPHFAYALCTTRIRDAELDGVDLSTWSVALDGAEAVTPAVLDAFAERFARWGLRREALMPVYGLAEAALAVTFPPRGRGFRTVRLAGGGFAAGEQIRTADDGVELATVGQPLPGFALSLRDDEGGEVPADHVGRLWIRGPSLMDGYLGQPEATARVLVDGWLDTGDLAVLIDGDLVITGRAKDVVIVRGQNHAPEEIEGAVAGIDGVRAGCFAAASHLPAGGATEEVVLMVEHRRDAGDELLANLATRCATAVLEATGLAARVEVLAPGTLLRTSSGKIRRQESLRQFLSGELAPPQAVTPLRLAGALARSQLAFAGARLRRRRDKER